MPELSLPVLVNAADARKILRMSPKSDILDLGLVYLDLGEPRNHRRYPEQYLRRVLAGKHAAGAPATVLAFNATDDERLRFQKMCSDWEARLREIGQISTHLLARATGCSPATTHAWTNSSKFEITRQGKTSFFDAGQIITKFKWVCPMLETD